MLKLQVVAGRWLRAFSASAAGERLTALGLESGRSNAYYNQQLRAALERQDVRGAAQIADALHASSPAAAATAAATAGAVIWTHNYDALLFAWGQRGDVQRAVALLDEMRARGRVSARSFNTALVACSKRRDLAAATRVLAHMRAAGKTPGAFAYANVINCCATRGGNAHAARRFWAEMLRDGVEPSIEVVNCMLRVFARSSDRSLEALRFVEDAVQEFDVTPDAITLSTLTQSLLFDKNVDAAVSFLERVANMKVTKKSLCIEIGVLNAALDGCRQQEDWENASRVIHLISSQSQQQQQQHDMQADAATKRLIKLCQARNATAPPVAWSFEDPHLPISARTKRKEQLKREKQSPAHLREVFAGIIAELEDRVLGSGGEIESGDVREILERVESLKQWERVFTANSIGDIERFLELCGAAGLELGVEMMNLYLFALGTQSGPTAVDKLETALHTLNEMIAQRSVDGMSFKNVLAMCNRLGRLDAAERVLELMKQHSTVSTYAYNALLNICARKCDIGRAEAYLNELRSLELAPNQITINTMLKAYASVTKKSSDTSSSSSHLPGIEKVNSGPRYAQRALKLFQRSSRKHKIEPSAATHFSLLRTFVQEADRIATGDADSVDGDEESDALDDEDLPVQIAKLIKRICANAPANSLDTGVFNAAIDYHQRCGDVDAAFGVFNTMKERGFEPNDLTLRLLFAACSRTEQADVGLKFLHYLMDDHAYHPTLEVLNGAIELCATSGSPQDALELFHGIESSGVLQPTEDTFIHLIHAFARQGNVSEALKRTHAMQERFGFASLDAYNRVLQACAMATAPLTALDILQHMKDSEGLVPNAISYDMVLKAFAKGDRRRQGTKRKKEEVAEDEEISDDEDFEYTDDMDASEDVKEDEDYGYDGEDDDDVSDEEDKVVEPPSAPVPAEDVRRMMSELLEEMRAGGIAPSSITYTRVIAACATRGDVKGVFTFFDDMMQSDDGVSTQQQLASESSLENYLRACSRANDLERAMQLADRLKQWRLESGKRASPRVVLQLLNTYKYLGAWREAVAGLRDLETRFGVRPNALFFNLVMETCNDVTEFRLVDQIFETMQNATAYRAVSPTSESYIEAIYAAEQQEEWVRATNLFLEMQNKCAKDGIPPAQLQRIALGRYNESRLRL